MVSSVHRMDFNWPSLAETKFLPACLWFLFCFVFSGTSLPRKLLSKIILRQAVLTGKPEVHQLFG